MDAARAVSAVHNATRSLSETLRPVVHELDPHGVVRSVVANDPASAVAIGQARSCVASLYETVAHVLTIQHLWDEQHAPMLARQRPVVMVTGLLAVTPRDAWRRAVESLAFGSSYGGNALSTLPEQDVLRQQLTAVLSAAERLAAALEDVEPYLATGAGPDSVAAVPTAVPAAVPATPAANRRAETQSRRHPRWGPSA